MFCDACGAQIQTSQRFCGTCGKPLGMVVAGRVSSRVAEHLQILGILWIVYAVFHLVGAGIVFLVGNTVIANIASMPPAGSRMPPGGLSFLPPLMTFISILVLGKGMFAAAAGIGLLQKQGWGRTVALVNAFISLINIPFGTGIGIYTLWVLMSSTGREDYEKLSAAEASTA